MSETPPPSGHPFRSGNAAVATLAFVCLALLLPESLLAGTLFLTGTQAVEVRFADRNVALLVPDHHAAGFDQVTARDAGGPLVKVSVTAKRVSPRTVFTPAAANRRSRRERRTGFSRIAAPLLKSGGTSWEVAMRLLGWLAENIRPSGEGPAEVETAEMTLEAGDGTCVGRSLLAAALFSEAGIPTRQVHGVFIGARGGVWSGQFHRWIEFEDPDLGWVPADPGVFHGLIEARYIVLWTSGVDEAAPRRRFPSFAPGTFVLRENYRLLLEDAEKTSSDQDVRAIKHLPVQYETVVCGTVAGAPPGASIIAETPSRQFTAPMDRATFAFHGLPASKVTLWLASGGQRIRLDQFTLRERTRVAGDYDLSRSGSALRPNAPRTVPSGSRKITGRP